MIAMNYMGSHKKENKKLQRLILTYSVFFTQGYLNLLGFNLQIRVSRY